jgi:hypothetical protein
VKGTKSAAKPAAKAKAAPKPAPKAAPKPAPRPAPKASRPAASPARASEPSVLERCEALRDAIQKSKLTAPDPWAYTAKARGWGQRAQELVDRIAREGATASAQQGFERLAGEVEGDRDFQEARRLF